MGERGTDESGSTSAWLHSQDGTQLRLVHWLPEGNARSRIILVHGHGEYMGQYSHVARHIIAHGHAVTGFDLRGHGHSSGKRVYVDRFSRYVDDLSLVVSEARGLNPDLPVFLLGHSLGGLIALHYAIRHKDSIAGLVASAPFVLPALPIPGLLLRVANLVSLLLPRLPTLKITDRPVTHDLEMQQRGERDPLAYRGRVLARTGNEMRLAGEELQRHADELDIPFYIFHGTEDHLADWRGSLLLFGKSRSRIKSVTLFNGLYHETMNELNRDRVLQLVTGFIEEQVERIEATLPLQT